MLNNEALIEIKLAKAELINKSLLEQLQLIATWARDHKHTAVAQVIENNIKNTLTIMETK